MTDKDLTLVLQSIRDGEQGAHEELLSLVYSELKAMAGAQMRRERAGHTLQPTALVNEAYLRLAGDAGSWQNRAHFFGAASQAMRRILVDHARKIAAQKRGSGAARVTFNEIYVEGSEPDLDLLALDQALDALEKHDPRLVEVVQLRYFTGLSIQAAAEVMNVSSATIKRDWAYARAWLLDHMS